MTDCPVCRFADVEGWWGQPGSHCRDCHLSCASISQHHCVQCHRQFGSEHALGLHQPRAAECVDPVLAVDRDGQPRLIARALKNCSGPVWVGETSEGLKSLMARVSRDSVSGAV